VSQRVSRVVVAGEPGRVTVDGEIVRHLVNVGPPGPVGPPGAGARIEGVVDTVGELPVAADPGSIWIVRPDMMHVWDEVDGWQAVGQVSIVSGPEGPKGDTGSPPKINDLPTRPGGPQPTDEFWLASAGGAADFKSTIAALTAAVSGNLSVSQLNTLLRFQVSIRVSSSGDAIANIPGRAQIAGSRPSNGVYTLTAPAGYTWHSAAAPSFAATSAALYAAVTGTGSNVLTVEVRGAESNALVNVPFQLLAQLT